MSDTELTLKEALLDIVSKLSRFYRESKRDDDLINLLDNIVMIVPEFADIALGNSILASSIKLNQSANEIPLNTISILAKTKFGNNALSAISLHNTLYHLSLVDPPYLATENFDTFLDILKNACLLKKCFSFIRISDGEGCYLAHQFLKKNHQSALNLTHYEDTMMQRWAGVDSNESIASTVYKDLVDAILNADEVGGLDINEEEAIFDKCKYAPEFNLFESYFGSVITRLILKSCNINSIFPASNAHIFFSKENILKIIQVTNKIPIFIGPVDISEKVTGIPQEFISVSPRFIDKIYENKNHNLNILLNYDNFFQEKILPHVSENKIFFISSGISGKILANKIKNCNSFAIDIGSATDYIYGYSSR